MEPCKMEDQSVTLPATPLQNFSLLEALSQSLPIYET